MLLTDLQNIMVDLEELLDLVADLAEAGLVEAVELVVAVLYMVGNRPELHYK